MRRSRLGGPALGTSMIAFERGRDDATVRRDTDENDASCAEVVKKKLQAECIGFNTTVGAGWTRVTNSPPGVPGLAPARSPRAHARSGIRRSVTSVPGCVAVAAIRKDPR